MKTLNKIKLLTFLLFIIGISSACKKNKSIEPEEEVTTPSTPNNLIKIGETYIVGANAKASIYTDKAFETGYNLIYVAFTDSTDGSALNMGHCNISPLMNMGSMSHGSPVENTSDTISTNGYFRSAVIFSMAGTASQWSLNINFHNHKNGKSGLGSLGVDVSASSPSKFKSVVLALDSNKKVFISLVQPTNPSVGTNNFEITLHQRVNGMTYPFIDQYTVEIEPEMPSMGHGSPNNINPTHVGKGHYLGKVNYTMSGLWYVHLKLFKNGTLISDDQYFEMTLQ
ncbi:MAG: FixH family protein [Bacteroidia bacterium]|nr:FixH family protein [Bacteroidia bacterium]